MKILLIALILSTPASARHTPIDSLRQQLSKAASAQSRIDVLNAMSHGYLQLSLGHAK